MKGKRISLLGAIAGDIIGSVYEFFGARDVEYQLFCEGSHITDDTVMTIAVADWILHPETDLVTYLQSYGRWNIDAGYGSMFIKWLLSENPAPYNSKGNGSAMRCSAAGLAANNIDEAMQLAKQSALPTHNHPEGIKGAQATAVAIFLAKQQCSRKEIKEELMKRFGYNLERTYVDVYNEPYCFHVLCEDTVPEAIISFLSSKGYEDAVWNSMLINIDCDTSAAITGAIAGAYYGIPQDIYDEAMKYLPEKMREVVIEFDKKFCSNSY